MLFTEGQEVQAEIITIDNDSKKIGLSIRLLEGGELSEKNAKANKGFMENIFAKVLKSLY